MCPLVSRCSGGSVCGRVRCPGLHAVRPGVSSSPWRSSGLWLGSVPAGWFLLSRPSLLHVDSLHWMKAGSCLQTGGMTGSRNQTCSNSAPCAIRSSAGCSPACFPRFPAPTHLIQALQVLQQPFNLSFIPVRCVWSRETCGKPPALKFDSSSAFKQ